MTKIFLVFFFCCFLLLNDCALSEVPPNAGPIQLLDFDSNENHTVKLAAGAVEKLFLNPLVSDRDVVVISIAGAFRKGKSFLLNYMLRYLYANYRSVEQPEEVVKETDWLGPPEEPLKGFPWKSSTKRETTGIVFWSDVFLYDAPNGDKIAIFLMDTQGLFDHSSSPTDNVRIFSLSALVSSVQLMNIYVMIEESHLEYLQFATEIAKFTAVESDSNSKPFQKLMFLIRDWSSPDEYNYGLEGGNRFMQSFLKIKNFHTAELKTVREYIVNTFETVNCFLMPYPGKIVARNSTYDGRWSVIDEEFVDAMKELFPAILDPQHLTIKTINGVAIKSFELSVYIKQYVELFKSETMPEAKSIYESTLDNQFQILISKAVELYLESISLYQERIKNPAEVDQLHEVAKSLAVKYFNEEKKFGKEEDGVGYKTELEEKLEKAFGEWKPVTLNSIGKIAEEQRKADGHRKTAEEAGNRSKVAKEEAVTADKKFVELQKQISQAKYDTEEARRAAEVIKQQLDRADRERQAAMKNESDAKKKYSEMKQKIELLEAQIQAEREAAAKQLDERVRAVRKRDGVSRWYEGGILGGFFNFLGFIGDSIAKIFV